MVKALVLTAITGAQIGRRYTVSERVSTIGSGPQCDVSLNDRHLSARHAEVRQIFDRWFIVPLAPGGISLNGTPVSGQSRLNPGDQLTLGGTTYRISYEALEERALGAAPEHRRRASHGWASISSGAAFSRPNRLRALPDASRTCSRAA